MEERNIPAIATKRFFGKNTIHLSTSRSTPTLNDLVQHDIPSTRLLKRQVVDLSTSMRRGSSQQATHVSLILPEQPKKEAASKRRHSFSSFLNAKYGKTAQVEETRQYKTPTTASPTNFTSTFEKSSIQRTKGRRPRSYSEVSFNLPQVERAPPVAITNKTPAYEYYGFVMYLASFVILGIYLIWAYVPDEILHSLGITYYPNRYWALAVPVWLMTIIWFIFFSYMSLNLLNTAPFDSYHCITDEHANLMSMESERISDRPSDWIPELHDIPISLVNIVLYQAQGKSNNSEMVTNYYTDEMSEEDAAVKKRHGKRKNKGK